jgi:hypothetical protein
MDFLRHQVIELPPPSEPYTEAPAHPDPRQETFMVSPGKTRYRYDHQASKLYGMSLADFSKTHGKMKDGQLRPEKERISKPSISKLLLGLPHPVHGWYLEGPPHTTMTQAEISRLGGQSFSTEEQREKGQASAASRRRRRGERGEDS